MSSAWDSGQMPPPEEREANDNVPSQGQTGLAQGRHLERGTMWEGGEGEVRKGRRRKVGSDESVLSTSNASGSSNKLLTPSSPHLVFDPDTRLPFPPGWNQQKARLISPRPTDTSQRPTLRFTNASRPILKDLDLYDVERLESLTFHPSTPISRGDVPSQLSLSLNQLLSQGKHFHVFQASAFPPHPDQEYIVKLAYLLDVPHHTELRLASGTAIWSALRSEALVLDSLEELQGVVVPRFYGSWISTDGEWGVVLLERVRGVVRVRWEDMTGSEA